MFEHMKNYEVLLAKISTWLRPTVKKDAEFDADEALLFIHIFCHRTIPYHFEEDDGWMAQNFFSGMLPVSAPRQPDCLTRYAGGTMASHDLLVRRHLIRALGQLTQFPPPALLPVRSHPSAELVHPRNTLFPNTGRLAEAAG
jgi:hypothetical protein